MTRRWLRTIGVATLVLGWPRVWGGEARGRGRRKVGRPLPVGPITVTFWQFWDSGIIRPILTASRPKAGHEGGHGTADLAERPGEDPGGRGSRHGPDLCDSAPPGSLSSRPTTRGTSPPWPIRSGPGCGSGTRPPTTGVCTACPGSWAPARSSSTASCSTRPAWRGVPPLPGPRCWRRPGRSTTRRRVRLRPQRRRAPSSSRSSCRSPGAAGRCPSGRPSSVFDSPANVAALVTSGSATMR